METIINISLITFTVLVIVIVEFFLYRKPMTVNKIIDLQKKLDKMDDNAKRNYNLDWKHDSLTEIFLQRKQTKSFTLIFSGVFLVFVLIGMIFIYQPSPVTVSIICLSSILLICYGLIKIADSKKFAIALLVVIFIMATGAIYLFDKAMSWSPYTYFYLCGFIILIGVFIMEKNSVSKKSI